MKDGKPMTFYDGVVGGRSVGAPGTVRALALAHQRYDKLPWAALFEPAITLAEQGFVISPRLAALLARTLTLPRTRTRGPASIRPTAALNRRAAD